MIQYPLGEEEAEDEKGRGEGKRRRSGRTDGKEEEVIPVA